MEKAEIEAARADLLRGMRGRRVTVVQPGIETVGKLVAVREGPLRVIVRVVDEGDVECVVDAFTAVEAT